MHGATITLATLHQLTYVALWRKLLKLPLIDKKDEKSKYKQSLLLNIQSTILLI